MTKQEKKAIGSLISETHDKIDLLQSYVQEIVKVINALDKRIDIIESRLNTLDSANFSKDQILSHSLPMNGFPRGVYFLMSEGEIVYVGMGHIFDRINAHRHEKKMTFDSFTYMEIRDEEEIERLETLYINKFMPRYNKSIPQILPSS